MRPAPEFCTSTGFAAVRLVVLASAVTLVPIGSLILTVADTQAGRIFAAATLLVGVIPVLGVRGYVARSKRSRYGFWFGTAVVLLAAGWLVARAPTGTPPGSRVRHHFGETGRHYPRLSLTNLLPEEDQLLTAFTVAAAIDPLLTAPQSAALRKFTREVYAELEADSDFRELGTAMGYTYAALFGDRAMPQHCYTYVPRSDSATTPRPLLVFFHGSGGNFKAYVWILAKVAEQAGMVIAAPNGGMGNWPGSDIAKQLEFAIGAAESVAAVDRNRIHVVGLSNGGLAVSRLAGTHGSKVASFVWISPVFDVPAIESAEVRHGCRGKRMLILSGVRDNRVPIDYVRRNAGVLSAGGANLSERYFGSADHFLMFTERAELTQTLTTWFLR